MSKPAGSLRGERMEIILSNLLRGGVVLAFCVVLIGGLIYLVHHGHSAPHYHTFRGEPADLRSMGGILEEAFRLTGRGIIQFGILLLIATPVARVAVSVVAFVLQRDRTYVVVTLIVLSLLLYSLLGTQL